MASANTIWRWLRSEAAQGATHMIVACDRFSHEDYPVYVMPDEDVHEVYKKYDGNNMQSVEEVYWFGGDITAQFALPRSFTYGPSQSTPTPS